MLFFLSNISRQQWRFWRILKNFLTWLLSCDIWYTGSHTIGNARCTTFRQRLYNQTGRGLADFTLDQSLAASLRNNCPRSGGDQNLFFLDFVSPTKFDNSYFKNLLANKGLLNSDQVLVTKSEVAKQLVQQYAENNQLFLEQFAKSMVKMGNLSPITGSRGEIRKNCRMVNSWLHYVISGSLEIDHM